METVQEASLPLGGFFSLVVNGNGYSSETTPLSYDASADKVSEILKCEGILIILHFRSERH